MKLTIEITPQTLEALSRIAVLANLSVEGLIASQINHATEAFSTELKDTTQRVEEYRKGVQ